MVNAWSGTAVSISELGEKQAPSLLAYRNASFLRLWPLLHIVHTITKIHLSRQHVSHALKVSEGPGLLDSAVTPFLSSSLEFRHVIVKLVKRPISHVWPVSCHAHCIIFTWPALAASFLQLGLILRILSLTQMTARLQNNTYAMSFYVKFLPFSPFFFYALLLDSIPDGFKCSHLYTSHILGSVLSVLSYFPQMCWHLLFSTREGKWKTSIILYYVSGWLSVQLPRQVFSPTSALV